jgi:hypothetical protein
MHRLHYFQLLAIIIQNFIKFKILKSVIMFVNLTVLFIAILLSFIFIF